MVLCFFVRHGLCRCNAGEAQLVASHVAQLVRAGVLQRDIAVISPYKCDQDCSFSFRLLFVLFCLFAVLRWD